jgi:hypothetical protein
MALYIQSMEFSSRQWLVEGFALDTSQKKYQRLCVMGKMRNAVKFVIYLFDGMDYFVLVVAIG